MLYGYYLIVQYNEFFFEAQFLHIPFIKDAVNHEFHLSNFFTTYGEHLFPGYNVFLFLNLKIFKITALFDLAISFFSSILLALLLSKSARTNQYSTIVILAIFFLILNPVQNSMFGMAMAAQFSTLMMAAITYLIFFNFSKKRIFLIVSLIFFYIIFFAGAYAAGFLVVLALMLLFSKKHENRTELLWIGCSSVLIYGLYYLIISRVTHHSLIMMSQGYQLHLKSILSFFNIMLGASFLGKAFFESFKSLTPYHLYGIFVFINLVFISRSVYINLKKLDSADKFFIALLLYSLANVFIVSIARNTNGLEGALGNWYQAHLRFIPIAIIYFYFRFLPKSLICNSLFIIIFLFGTISGYYNEFMKAKYIPGWRESYNRNISNYLSASNGLEQKSNDRIMLWDDNIALDGIVFLYQNNLSYFKNGDYVNYSGISDDQWIERNQKDYIDIFCPGKADFIIIKFDLINQTALNLLSKKYHLKNENTYYYLTYKFDKPIKQFRLNLSGLPEFQHDKNLDQRDLILHVSKVSCI